MSKLISYTLLSLTLLSMAGCSFNSATAQKKSFLTSEPKDQIFGKAHSLVHVKLTKKEVSGNEITLTATVLPNSDMPNAEILWKLPDHIKVLEGDLKQKASLVSGESKVFELLISNENITENDQIFFFAHEKRNGENYGASQSLVFSSEEKASISSFSKKKNKGPKIIY